MTDIKIEMQTLAVAVVDALDRRSSDGPMPLRLRRRLIAAYEKNPDLAFLLPVAKAKAEAEEIMEHIVTLLQRKTARLH